MSPSICHIKFSVGTEMCQEGQIFKFRKHEMSLTCPLHIFYTEFSSEIPNLDQSYFDAIRPFHQICPRPLNSVVYFRVGQISWWVESKEWVECFIFWCNPTFPPIFPRPLNCLINTLGLGKYLGGNSVWSHHSGWSTLYSDAMRHFHQICPRPLNSVV